MHSIDDPSYKQACFGRWNFFPHGYDFEQNHIVDERDFAPFDSLAPHGPFQIDLYREFLRGIMSLRRDWMPKGPSWGRTYALRIVELRMC